MGLGRFLEKVFSALYRPFPLISRQFGLLALACLCSFYDFHIQGQFVCLCVQSSKLSLAFLQCFDKSCMPCHIPHLCRYTFSKSLTRFRYPQGRCVLRSTRYHLSKSGIQFLRWWNSYRFRCIPYIRHRIFENPS